MAGPTSLKSTPNDSDFLRNFSWQFYFTLRVFARNLLAWASNPGFTSNKPTHYLIDYGNFKCSFHKRVCSLLDALLTVFNRPGSEVFLKIVEFAGLVEV